MNVSGSLYISSFDRKSNEDYNNVTYQIPNIQSLSGIALNSFDFVYGLNNININNATAYFETATQSFQVILTNGNYNYTTLQTEVLLKLNALGLGVFTLTFTNDIYTLTAPVPIRFLTNFNNGHRDWVDMLGLQKNTILKTVFVGGVANIAYTDAIYILSEQLHEKQTIRDNSSNQRLSSVLGVVYVNKEARMNAAEVLSRVVEPKHITDRIINPKMTYLDLNKRINTITIRLVDQQGLELPLTTDNNGSCQYTLEIMTINQEGLGL